MRLERKKFLFNVVGSIIVVTWLMMIGILIKKVHYTDFAGQTHLSGKACDIHSPESEWMEIFLKGEKVGYSMNHVSPVENDYLIQEEIFLKMNLMGHVGALHSITHCVVDPQFFLKTFKFEMTSGAVDFQISGTVDNDRMSLKIGKGKNLQRKVIQMPERPVMGAAMAQFFKCRRVEVGQSFTFPVFDPSTLTQKEMTLKVKARETLTINHIAYDALRLEAEMWGHNLAFWLDKNGSVLKQEGFMGMTLVRSSADAAHQGMIGSGGRDFYEQVGVCIKKKLHGAGDLTYLKLKVKGLDGIDFDAHWLDNGRQKFDQGILEISREKNPVRGRSGPVNADLLEELKPFLASEIGIESDDDAIIYKAHDILGDVREPVLAAKMLLDWVYKNVEKRPVISFPSAAQVLETMVGDCNEHAALLTALLRAAGIPARLCVGLVYARGIFLYHAWCEIYVGEWISADPTLNQFPADVTHIKLVEGGLDRQVEIIGLIGKIQLEVLVSR